MPAWTDILLPLSVILFLGLFGSFVSKWLNKPALLAFILIGIIVSNVIKIPVLSQQLLQPLGTLGVVLLLFTVGLESPLYAVLQRGSKVLLIAVLQMALCSVGIFFLLLVFVRSIPMALLLAFPMALSSTAVVGKLLSEQGENSSKAGNTTLGVAIIQDLASVLFITILMAFIGNTTGSMATPILNSIISITLLVAMYSASMLAMDKLFVLQHFNREELALFTFALLFLALWVFGKLSIPETTAGFLVGAILAHRVEQHEIFSQVRAFRDVLLVLFFFFLGTYVSALSVPVLLLSFLFACMLMLFKFGILAGILAALGYHKKTAYWIGFDLMQVGEFSFVILSLLGLNSLISQYQYQFFLLVVIWSLLLFSVLYQRKHWLYELINRVILSKLPAVPAQEQNFDMLPVEQVAVTDHIIICGYGRVGAYVGHGLLLSKIPLVVIETDRPTVTKLKEKGISVLYGDATEADLLRYAKVESARFLIVALPDAIEQEKIIVTAQRLNPKIRVITRTHLAKQIRHLKALGVEYLFQPEFEAAVTILKRLLKIYNRDTDEIKKHIHYLKIEHGMAS